MSTKRVGVRLVAEGGQQVRAEFEGVGKSGEEAFARIDARAQAMSRAVAVAAAAAATAAAVAAAAMIRSGLQTVDAQAKLAQSLDTTVESVQVLERAGDLAGVSMGRVEQATIQLTRRLSQAAAGAGPAAAALDRLGLSAEGLMALPLDQRLMEIQRALEANVPAAERAGVAAQLFGDRAGLVFSRIDTATLRTATEDVQRFGVAVSEQDAEQIQRTNDALSRLGLVWRGLSNQLAAEAAPMLERTADALAEITDRSGPLGQALGALVSNADALAKGIAVLAVAMGTRYAAAAALAITRTGALTSAMVALRAATILLGGPVGVLAALIGGAGAAWLLFRDNANEALPTMEAVEEAQIALNKALGTFSATGAPDAGREAVAYARNLEQTALAALAAAEAQIAFNEARLAGVSSEALAAMAGMPGAESNPMLGVSRQLEQARADARAAAAALDGARRTANALSIELHSAGETGVTELEEIVLAADAADQALRRSGGGGRAAAQGIQEVADAADAVVPQVNEMQSAFETAFVGIITGTAKARDAIRNLLADLARMFAQRAFQALAGSLFGGPTLVSGPSVPAVRPMPRPFSGGGFTGWGPRSGGLDGQGGFLAMLHPRETVIDHHRGQSGVREVRVVVDARSDPGVILDIAQSEAVRVTRAGIAEYDRAALPSRMAQLQRDPRRRFG